MSSNFNARFPPKPATKKSIFERQRAEAEAKRQREAAETAAVYEDFVKSFDDGGAAGAPRQQQAQQQHQQQQPSPSSKPQPKGGATIGSTGGRRHFSMPSGPSGLRNSGPGSLGQSHGSSSAAGGGGYTDRRYRDGRPNRTSGVGSRLAFDDDDDDDDDDYEGGNNHKNRDGDSEEEGQIGGAGSGGGNSTAANRAEEKATSKPTIRLANLPPGTSPAAIKALMAGNSSLAVDGIRILPTAPTGTTTDRKSVAAIATLAADTAASDIDAAVSAMQNRYLGFGYYLNLHRHLSSAVVASSTIMAATVAAGGAAGGGASAQPFGARPVPPPSKAEGRSGAASSSSGFAPPGSYQGGRHHQGGFGSGFGHQGGQGHGRGRGMGIPPPSTYNSVGSGSGASREGILHVPVRPPRDVKKLRMIHKVIEHVLDQGPEFEALLMSRPEVQHDEKWAWIWDARCEAGIWYRYRLWETVTGLRTQRGQGKYMPLFEDSHAWKTPDNPLPYEFDTSIPELVSDSEYNSSDDSEFEEGNNNKPGEVDNDNEDTFLNPLEKARLAHLLARLPTTLSKLRKGDVARVTAFAITHASRGANEVVDMIVSNVERPYAYTAANPDYQRQRPDNAAGNTHDEPTATTAVPPEPRDTSGAQLIAVYVVSDILSSSATSGIRHAWRFRQLFDAALRSRRVFEGLGLLAEKLNWGRLRADKWKRSIGLVLGHWEGWSVFSAETQEYLVSSFENPPSANKEEKGAADVEGATVGAAAESATGTTSTGATTKKSRWKTVDTTAVASTDESAASGFRPVDTAMLDTSADAGPGPGEIREVGSDDYDADDDEWAYRSEYTDDEALDLACMDDEDIDGEPMDDDGGVGAGPIYLDGFPLSADEISALLVGDIAEMSEEGEIGTDDDDDDDEAYDMSGLSAMSSGDGDSGSGSENGGDEGGDEGDVAMEDVSSHATRSDEKKQQLAQVQAGPAAGRIASAAQAQASSSTPPPSSLPSRKRMRAADMFADSDPEGDDEA